MLGIVLPVLTVPVLFAEQASTGSRPNVLFVVVDDLRPQLACYGATQMKTPNVDRLANKGMRFERAYVQAAFCNPSRNSFLSGYRPGKTRIFDNHTRLRETLPDAVTLPQLFKESGYHTYNLGKIFHGGALMNDPRSWSRAEHPKVTDLGNQGEGRDLTGGKLKWCRWLAAEGDDEDQPDGQIANLAVEFLKERESSPSEPFFLAVGFHKPHDPFNAPARYFDLYPEESLKLHRDPEDRPPDNEFALAGGFKRAFDLFTDRERLEFLRAYYACTSFMDAQLGKVLDALEASSFAANTVIVFLSDHGYHLGERNWWNKNTLFEWTGRSPLIVFAPGMKAAGKPCNRIVEFIDIYPTVAELCGLNPPDDLHGTGFSPLLDDPEQPWKSAAFTQLMRGPVEGRTVRTEHWRYTEWDGGGKGVELYDHRKDPGEYYNLSADPEHSEDGKYLRELLRSGFSGTKP